MNISESFRKLIDIMVQAFILGVKTLMSRPALKNIEEALSVSWSASKISGCVVLEELKQPWHIVPLAGSIGHAESLYNGPQCITMHHDGILRMLTLAYIVFATI